MASLTLYDQHVNWQNRVIKEIFQASKFKYFSHSESFKEEPKLLLRFKLSRLETPAANTQFSQSQRQRKIYNEVRGKYSRPDRSFNSSYLPEIPLNKTLQPIKKKANPNTAESENQDLKPDEKRRKIRQEKLVNYK